MKPYFHIFSHVQIYVQMKSKDQTWPLNLKLCWKSAQNDIWISSICIIFNLTLTSPFAILVSLLGGNENGKYEGVVDLEELAVVKYLTIQNLNLKIVNCDRTLKPWRWVEDYAIVKNPFAVGEHRLCASVLLPADVSLHALKIFDQITKHNLNIVLPDLL